MEFFVEFGNSLVNLSIVSTKESFIVLDWIVFFAWCNTDIMMLVPKEASSQAV